MHLDVVYFSLKGVDASHQMARTDKLRVERYKSDIIKASVKHDVDPAVIAAIMSGESRAGHTLDSRGYGDNGKAFGLMQVVTYCCSYSICIKNVVHYHNIVFVKSTD